MRPLSLRKALLFATLVAVNLLHAQTVIIPGDSPQTLEQGKTYTFTGADDYYVNPSFFVRNNDGTYVFRAVSGTYVVQANASLSYLQIRPCSSDGTLAMLQADGTGAVYIIGDNFGLPSASTNAVGWENDKAVAMAPVKDKKYEITAVLGKELGTSYGFKFYGDMNWGKEFYATESAGHVYRIRTEGNTVAVGISQHGETGVPDGYPYFPKEAGVAVGDTVVLTLDFSNGDALGILSATLRKSSNTNHPQHNGVPFLTDATYGYSLVTAIGPGQPCLFTGASAFTDSDWYMDPDYFKTDADGNYTFVPVHGLYKFIADFDHKYFKVFPVKKADDGTYNVITYDKISGEGSVWAIGGIGLGKPSYATNGHNWYSDVPYALPMAEVKHKVYQLTLTVGQQIQAGSVSFALYGQPGWNIQFGTDPKMTLQENASNILTTDVNGNISQVDDSILENGQTIVLTLDCTSPTDTKLSYSVNTGTGITAPNAYKKGFVDAWYTLQGVRIARPVLHGLYICNGKKVIR